MFKAKTFYLIVIIAFLFLFGGCGKKGTKKKRVEQLGYGFATKFVISSHLVKDNKEHCRC